MAIEQMIGDMCLDRILCLALDGCFVGLTVSAADLWIDLCGKCNEVAVGRHDGAVDAQRIVGELCSLAVVPGIKLR